MKTGLLRNGLTLSCVVSSLLLATSCTSQKEQCSIEGSEANKIVTESPEMKTMQKTAEINAQQKQTERNNAMTKTKTSSGLEYTILEPGDETSKTPVKNSRVTVHYTGWLADAQGNKGKKFDSSVDRGQPFQFKIGLGQVIAGWDEGVMSMHKGEKRRLFIPSKLGYGAAGADPVIPPYANLIFDVELIDFK